MKIVLLLKRTDLAIQLAAFCIPPLIAFASGDYFGVFYAYFFVGGSQVVSFVMHAAPGRQPWTGAGRKKYGRLLGLTLAIGLGSVGLFWMWNALGPLVLCLCVAALILTPCMAVWYFLICARETGRVEQLSKREMLIVRSV